MAFKLADFVKETTTSTGTGSIALAGAATGYQAFSAKLSIGDTTTYSIRSVDVTGAPTGEWELVGGTYTGANTLSRDTVLASSNSDAAVSFSAGTKEVYITMPSMRAAWIRERLTADRTYYVRTDGSDNNTGLSDTSGGAFLTIQKAVDVVALLDIGINNVTIKVADGTYPVGASNFNAPVGSGSVSIVGNVTTPANCLVSATTGNCFGVYSYSQATRLISGFKVENTAGSGIAARNGGFVQFSLIDFGSCSAYHVATANGAIATASGNYVISGGAAVHVFAEYASIVNIYSRTVTITGTPAMTSGFVIARQTSMVAAYGMTFSGASTGPRYEAQTNGVIFVNGAASTYFPGSASGATATGGQYA